MSIYRATISLVIFSSFFLGCSKKSDNPIVQPVQEELLLSVPADTIILFPRSSKDIDIPILSNDLGNDNPRWNGINREQYSIGECYYSDKSHTKLSISFFAQSVTPTPVTEMFSIYIGNKSCTIPLTLYISDFYYANKFITNIPNDTIVLERGSSFLLRIGCIDSSGSFVSKAQISRLSISGGLSGVVSKKYIFQPVDRDSMYYCFGFAAFSDISSNNPDPYYSVVFTVSNKELVLPIVIKY